MNVNFSYIFKDLEGHEIEEPKEQLRKVMCEVCNKKEALWAEMRTVTLRRISCSALIANYEDERKLDGEEKVKRWNLAEKIQASNGSCELSTDEIVLIKKLIAKGFSALVVGQAFKVLEGG